MPHPGRLLRPAAALAVTCLAGELSAQSVTKTQDLAFGGFAANSGGTVIISPANARSSTGDVKLLTGGANGQYNAAVFQISGIALLGYTISLPADNAVKLTSPQNNSMTIASFASQPANQGNLSATGTATVSVGATLTVGSNQPPGSYTGSFTITIAYQ